MSVQFTKTSLGKGEGEGEGEEEGEGGVEHHVVIQQSTEYSV